MDDRDKSAEVSSRSQGVLRTSAAVDTLDELDLRLIELLQEDGRRAFADLARSLGLDQRTVRRRVDRLLADAFIDVRAVTDPALIGYGALAIVCISSRDQSLRELTDRLGRLHCVDYVTVTTGRFNVQVEVLAADDHELAQILAQQIRPAVGDATVEVLYALRLHFQRARYSARSDTVATPGVRPSVLDIVDQRIVGALADDGRATFGALARRIGVSETLVRERYRRLTDSGAMRVLSIGNPLRLGYQAVCWLAVSVTAEGSAVEVAEQLTEISAVTYVVITAGSIDLLVEVVCRTHEDLIDLLDSQLRRLPGIARTEAWMYLDLLYKPLHPRASSASCQLD